jgi:V8-like Glu-specific endopeptidase
MAARKSRTSGARARPGDRPVLGDMLLSQADTPDRDDPPVQLDSPRNFFVIDHSRQAQARRGASTALVPLRGGGGGALTIDHPGAVFGHMGGALEAIPLPKAVSATPKDSEPFRPRWSGVSFAPRAAGLPSPAVLRRRNGMRVQPEYVFPPDGRQVYYPNSYPWRIVGRIFVWSNASSPNWAWSGSAGLVSRNAILTASHVVPWNSGSNWKALFVPAYYDGTSLYGASAASWVTSARGYKDHGQGDDMAVMRLAQPLGDWLGYFGYKTYNDDWEDGNYWTLAGYPGDVANAQRPSANYWFPITDDDNDGAGVELEYKADTNSGNSGGPVWGWWDGKPYVIGTHSGGEDNFGEPKQNVAAGGSALSSLIAWARSNW